MLTSDKSKTVQSNEFALPPVTFNYVGECRAVAKMYFEGAAEQETAIAKLDEYTEKYLTTLSDSEIDTLDVTNIAVDFQLLTLPVRFSIEELLRLHERNCNNPLFCRALTEYYNNRTDYGLLPDFRDSFTARRDIVKLFMEGIKNTIYRADCDGFLALESHGYFETVDNKLKGNGLFNQPTIFIPLKDR